MSRPAVYICDDGARFTIRWTCEDSDLWREILADFKRVFWRADERSYSGATKMWSLPGRYESALQQWCDTWFDADCQVWEELEDGADRQSDAHRSQRAEAHHKTPSIDAAYRVLCLTPAAPRGLVNVAYKFWARQLHPDTGHGDTAAMACLNTAVETLRQELLA